MKEYETKATQWKVSATQNWRMWCRNRRPWFESVWDTKPQRLEGRGFRCKDPKIRGYKDSTVRPNGSQIGSCKWHLLVPTLLSERSWNHGIPEVSRESQPNWIKIFKTRVNPSKWGYWNELLNYARERQPNWIKIFETRVNPSNWGNWNELLNYAGL